MDVVKQLKWRYATKKFDNSLKLSDKKIEILKQAFNLTATSFGLQTIKLIIISDKYIREQLLKHSYNQKQVLDASHLLVICIQDNILEEDVEALYDNIKNIRDKSNSILYPYKNSLVEMMEKKSVEERLRWSSNQAYIALGNLMTVCAIEEIDSCPMEGFDTKAFDEILNLKDKNLISTLLLSVGYRAQDDMFATLKKVRKDLSHTVIEM